VPYIKSVSHQKFVALSHKILADHPENENCFVNAKNREKLIQELGQIEQLAEMYLRIFYELSKISQEYNTLHKSIKYNIRYLKAKKNNRKSGQRMIASIK